MARHGMDCGDGGPSWRGLAGNLAAMGRSFGGDWDDFGLGDFWDGPWRKRHGPGGGRRRMFGGGELRLILLRLIADEPRHGYELMKAIEDMTGGAYSPSPGTVYPALALLEDEGAIAESAGAGEEGGRRAFAATQIGREELAARADEVEALMQRLSRLGERQRQRQGPPELGRAALNLGRVIANRFGQGRIDSETIERIVDIIDDAARRIERL